MTLDYQNPHPSPNARPPCRAGDVVARVFAVYFIVSALTLPLMPRVWIGDVPVFAIVQVPKVFVLGHLRTGVLMPLIRAVGLSRGSFSPDYSMTGPYALVLTYLLPVLAVAFLRRTRRGGWLRSVRLLLLTEAVDLIAFLIFRSTQGFTIA